MKPVIAALLALAPLLSAAEPADLSKVSTEMAEAAKAFIQSLDDAQSKKARFEFGSDERENWHFIPKDRLGLPLAELNEAQLELSRKLLNSAMSEKGLLKIDTIIQLESFLAELENDPVRRDPKKYYTSIFGEPAADGTWGWRFEGHHLSLNFTLSGGKSIDVTPSFFAANPAEVRADHKMKGTRPLAAEEELARALATALHSSEKPVVYTDKAPDDILTGADRKLTQLEPVGVRVSDMTDAQRDGLMTLIAEYANRFRPQIAMDQLEKIRTDMENLRFGWAGSLAPNEGYYYRIQGTDFLVEVANVQNNANHIHAVWRDRSNDFGHDVLGGHHREHKH
jgi:hypothetical protein